MASSIVKPPAPQANATPPTIHNGPRNEERFAKQLQALRDGLRRAFQATSTAELRLYAASLTYVLIWVCFFLLAWRGHELRVFRYVLYGSAVPLTFAVDLIVKEKRIRVFLLCVLGLGTLSLQTRVENIIIQMAEQLARTTDELGSMAFHQNREVALQYKEAEHPDHVVAEPDSIIRNGEHADKGFDAKAERLLVSAFSEEATLLVGHPELLAPILQFPEDPRARLSAYEQLIHSHPRLQDSIAPVRDTLREAVDYLDIADLFKTKLEATYRRLEYDIDRKSLLRTQICGRLDPIVESLRKIAAAHPAAGLYNHIGNLAMNCGQPDIAFASVYQAMSIDKQHVTVYESMSYLLWLVNRDSRNALKYAEEGLEVSRNERDGVEKDFDMGAQMYAGLANNNHGQAPLITHHVKTLERRVGTIQREWAGFMDRLTDRLENDFSYYSALRMENENEAKGYMNGLYEKTPNDANVQDTLGFVLMRFANSKADLDRAEQLFTLATQNPNADPETVQLASAHLDELEKYRLSFTGHNGLQNTRLSLEIATNESESLLATKGGLLNRMTDVCF